MIERDMTAYDAIQSVEYDMIECKRKQYYDTIRCNKI